VGGRAGASRGQVLSTALEIEPLPCAETRAGGGKGGNRSETAQDFVQQLKKARSGDNEGGGE